LLSLLRQASPTQQPFAVNSGIANVPAYAGEFLYKLNYRFGSTGLYPAQFLTAPPWRRSGM